MIGGTAPGKLVKIVIQAFIYSNLLFSHQRSNILEGLLNGQCTENCDQDPLLTDFILTEMGKPSEMSPVLDNPDSAFTLGQEGQVRAILNHFNNKVGQFTWYSVQLEVLTREYSGA